MQFSSVSSVSPSFTANSSNNLADIAARVVEEFRNENGLDDDDYDDIYSFTDERDGNCSENVKENEEGEFEFAVVCRNPNLSPVSADEIFSNGEILPRYPLFDRSLLLDDVDKSDVNSKPEKVRHPLGKLFREERESVSCTSSSPSESDNLEGVAPETYCIWKPKVESPERCKKSNSTGNSSKRWKFGSFLHRSNSDSRMSSGKHTSAVDFSNLTATKKRSEKVKKFDNTAKVAGADDDGELNPVTDESKSGNKTNTGSNRFRSYLRYKKEQVLPH